MQKIDRMEFNRLDPVRPLENSLQFRILDSKYGSNRKLSEFGFNWEPGGGYWFLDQPNKRWNKAKILNSLHWRKYAIHFEVIEKTEGEEAAVVYESPYKRLAISGATYEIKEELKESKFRWDSDNEEWFRDFSDQQSTKSLRETLMRKPWWNEENLFYSIKTIDPKRKTQAAATKDKDQK